LAKTNFISLQTWPRSWLRAFRLLRDAVLVILQPLDYGYRAINCKQTLPPLRLRRYVGPLGSFESSGAEFLKYLRELAALRRDESVLDIGCGCGLMALQLENYLNADGRYVGVDIHAPSIRWCATNISARRQSFQFVRVNASNSVFNPTGAPATEFRFPFPDKMFDVILAKSVFTHMRIAEVDNYLGEIARLLTDGGRCLATFFLLNEKQNELKQQGLNQLRFEFGDDASRYVYRNSPESAIAHREDLVLPLLRKHNLALVRPVIYGSWSGLREGLSFQDMLLIQKTR
jgi:SAM-dependent methyltransferase